VGVETATLGLEASAHAFRLDHRRKSTKLVNPGAQTQPDDPGEPASLESAELAEPHLEGGRLGGGHAIGDPLGQRKLDMPEKSDCQVKVLSRRPAKFGGERGAAHKKAIERRVMRLG
jgi:hypothetical protein